MRGLRVLDFGQGIASPYCAMLLGVYGADVIKVEPPEGDWSRFLGTTYGSHTTLSAVYNRGKRSLCLDMKHKDGIAIARRLAKDCDVLIEGFRPGVAARLGIGYEELSRDNPGLIYLSVSAFGQSGPYSKRPGSDSVAQAFSGLVSINVGNDGTPHRVGTTISDVVTGVYAFQAIATTLFARATVGTGRWIDVNLCQSTSALLGHKVAEHILEGGAPRALNVPAGSYQTTDGWMMVTLVNEPQYKRLCAAIGRDDLASDPRFADFARRADAVDALIPQLREVFLTQPTDAWLARLHAADLIAERILNPGEWLRNVHVEATSAAVCQQTPGVGPVYSPRTPGIASFSEDDLRPAPDIGQDSYEVLLEAGFERGAIDDLVKAGAVRQAKGEGRRGMSTDLVRYSVSGNIAEIMLDRPPVNALSMDLIDALLAALSKARDDEAVRAVIIGSAHKVFCAGLDLDIVRGKPGIETKKFLERLYFALNDTQYRMGKPTIAAVDGAVRAGGMTIAISCDMIIAGDACTFGYPEIDVGLIPAIHFVQLPRLVGKHQAFGPLFLGEPFDAATAFRMGLLSEVVPKGTALDRAREIARKLAAKSPIVMKIGRDAFMRAVDADFRRSVENAAESFALVATTEDCQEGLNAFVEKRTPNYRGR